MTSKGRTAWIITTIVAAAFILVLGVAYQLQGENASLVAQLKLIPAPNVMDCTWEAWERRSISEEMDYRERAVAECVSFTIERDITPEVCEQYRYQGVSALVESELEMAQLSLRFMLNAAGAGQCTYHDGSYWSDNGGWVGEAIHAQEMLISWMDSTPVFAEKWGTCMRDVYCDECLDEHGRVWTSLEECWFLTDME